MQLKINSITQGVTNQGKGYRKVNNKYYVWDSKIVLENGKTYEVEVTDGAYPKITSAKPVNNNQTQSTSNEKSNSNTTSDNRDKMMIMSYAKDIALKAFEANPANPIDGAIKIISTLYLVNSLLKEVNIESPDEFMERIKKIQSIEQKFGIEVAGVVDNGGDPDDSPKE
jgi:hypothetical protein